jgi:hypothetical protein
MQNLKAREVFLQVVHTSRYLVVGLRYRRLKCLQRDGWDQPRQSKVNLVPSSILWSARIVYWSIFRIRCPVLSFPNHGNDVLQGARSQGVDVRGQDDPEQNEVGLVDAFREDGVSPSKQYRQTLNLSAAPVIADGSEPMRTFLIIIFAPLESSPW